MSDLHLDPRFAGWEKMKTSEKIDAFADFCLEHPAIRRRINHVLLSGNVEPENKFFALKYQLGDGVGNASGVPLRGRPKKDFTDQLARKILEKLGAKI